MTTNITEEHRRVFEALTSGEHDNFTLFSCFLGTEPAAALTREVRLILRIWSRQPEVPFRPWKAHCTWGCGASPEGP